MVNLYLILSKIHINLSNKIKEGFIIATRNTYPNYFHLEKYNFLHNIKTTQLTKYTRQFCAYTSEKYKVHLIERYQSWI